LSDFLMERGELLGDWLWLRLKPGPGRKARVEFLRGLKDDAYARMAGFDGLWLATSGVGEFLVVRDDWNGELPIKTDGAKVRYYWHPSGLEVWRSPPMGWGDDYVLDPAAPGDLPAPVLRSLAMGTAHAHRLFSWRWPFNWFPRGSR